VKAQRKIFYRNAEVCPQCGAVESFRKGTAGSQRKMANGDRITYVNCKMCGYRALRWVRLRIEQQF